MTIEDTVREQLIAIGIDPAEIAPSPEIQAESSDITWQRQTDYLSTVLTPNEGMALSNVFSHPTINQLIALGGPSAENAKNVLLMSEQLMQAFVEIKWPRKE